MRARALFSHTIRFRGDVSKRRLRETLIRRARSFLCVGSSGLGDAYIIGGNRKSTEALKKAKEDKELQEAMKFIDELHRDPVKLEQWVDRVVEGWKKKRASGRPLKISRGR